MTIVLCSKGYPGKYNKNEQIGNIEKIKLKKNLFIFHAGTKYIKDKLVNSGGRVLNVTAFGKNFLSIRKIISILKKLIGKRCF